MQFKGPNHPFVVWAACFLWLTSMFAITWSLLLFFCVGDILLLTGTDLINAFVLLSGIIMLPTNVNILYAIASGKKIDRKAKVVCCPLWLSITWIIIINCVGVLLCVERIYTCQETTSKCIKKSINHYRNVPKYKHFIDNLQWSLQCCGLNSYRDWFNREWYDKIRDYEWDPFSNKRNPHYVKKHTEVDSVPLSCCKSGSCISNYLSELGTYSINTNGCGRMMYRIVMVSMNAHLIVFLSIILVEILLLIYIPKNNRNADNKKGNNKVQYDVRHIMTVNDNFDMSSGSCQLNAEDSEDIEAPKYLQEEIDYDHLDTYKKNVKELQ